MGMYDITPLGVDACLSDTSAACTYWHLKCRVLRGAIVIESELRFVGFAEERPECDGWQNAATNLEILYRGDHDPDELSSEDSVYSKVRLLRGSGAPSPSVGEASDP